jgi:hypothetical protein
MTGTRRRMYSKKKENKEEVEDDEVWQPYHTSTVEYADVPCISTSKTTISLSIFGVTLNDKCPTTRILLIQLVRGPPPAAQHNLEILEDTYVHNIFTLFLLETGFSPITEQTLLAVTPSQEYQHWRYRYFCRNQNHT